MIIIIEMIILGCNVMYTYTELKIMRPQLIQSNRMLSRKSDFGNLDYIEYLVNFCFEDSRNCCVM